jgi:hypothetical protein
MSPSMENVPYLLAAIVVLLFLIWLDISSISKRLKQRFPNEKERDYEWAKNDPLGHYEAHKDDKE